MMKRFKLTILIRSLISGSFLSLLYIPLAVSQEVKSFISSRYHYTLTQKDRNSDGKYDAWIYESLRKEPIKEEYDENFDGIIDHTIEWIRMKNVKVESRDKNFSGSRDEIIFYYPKRQYVLVDEINYDRYKYFDRLFIKDEKGTLISKHVIDDEIPSQLVPSLLVDLLIKKELNEEKLYVLDQTFKKYAEIQYLLNRKKWDLLLEKTREYLDFPSNDTLPIVLKLIEPNEKTPAALRRLKYLRVDPTFFKDADIWLSRIDHEMIHAIQAQRIFNFLNTDPKVSWNNFTQYVDDQINGVNRGILDKLFGSISPSFFENYLSVLYASSYYAEYEAYVHTLRRGEYHQLLYVPNRATYSDQLLIQAYIETIRENNLTPPAFFDYLTDDIFQIKIPN